LTAVNNFAVAPPSADDTHSRYLLRWTSS